MLQPTVDPVFDLIHGQRQTTMLLSWGIGWTTTRTALTVLASNVPRLMRQENLKLKVAGCFPSWRPWESPQFTMVPFRCLTHFVAQSPNHQPTIMVSRHLPGIVHFILRKYSYISYIYIYIYVFYLFIYIYWFIYWFVYYLFIYIYWFIYWFIYYLFIYLSIYSSISIYFPFSLPFFHFFELEHPTGWRGHGDLQTFGGQNRCWTCAKKNTVNYRKNCFLRMFAGMRSRKKNAFFLHGSSSFEFLVLCCMQPLGCVMCKKHCKYGEKIAFGAM